MIENIDSNDLFGYGRCSTDHQDYSYMYKLFKERGIPENHMYFEYISGGKTRDERPEYDKIMKELEQHSKATLYISDFTRAARNNLDIYFLTQDIKRLHLRLEIASYIVDCREKEMDPISELLLGILGQFGTFDLKLKHQQIRNGIANRKAEGLPMGRPFKTKEMLEDNPKFLKYYLQWKRKQISLCEMQRLLGLKSRTTVYNWIHIYEEK